MPKNYLIAIGGTGSRCLEAAVYLTAAGVFKEPLHLLIIDPDQNNGNSTKARQIITDYHALHLARQPKNAQPRGLLRLGAKMPDPTLFQSPINSGNGESMLPQE